MVYDNFCLINALDDWVFVYVFIHPTYHAALFWQYCACFDFCFCILSAAAFRPVAILKQTVMRIYDNSLNFAMNIGFNIVFFMGKTAGNRALIPNSFFVINWPCVSAADSYKHFAVVVIDLPSAYFSVLSFFKFLLVIG